MTILLVLLSLTAGRALAGIPCQIVQSEECWDEPKTVCNTVQKPFTSVTFEEKCSSLIDKTCTTVVDTLVEFVPREECITHHDQKCDKIVKQECTTVFVP
jgi:hypothetical protein